MFITVNNGRKIIDGVISINKGEAIIADLSLKRSERISSENNKKPKATGMHIKAVSSIRNFALFAAVVTFLSRDFISRMTFLNF